MLTFLFGVLGSVLFWIGYFLVTIFIGTYLLREKSPDTLKWMKGEDHYRFGVNPFWMVAAYTIWPIILLYYLFKIIMKFLIFCIFRNIICLTDEAIPKIKIVKED